ncbi:MAG: glycosyltransferase [Ignavibacteriales bacterium]|nr:glycosyltransferase [Ignavibacteriales bacterium]
MIFFLIFIFALFIYIFLKLKLPVNEKIFNEELKISVIVAAKNEVNNLPNLIKSLENQKYPINKYEVIIVDDNSTDSTFKKISELIKYKSNFSIIKVDYKKFEGKRGALQIGIEKSNYEYIVITDADCQPEKYWLKSISNKFSEKFDFIFGISPFYQKQSFLNKIICFDNLWVHILTFSFAIIGLPYSASARSFAFRNDSFNKIEGYKNTTDTLSGDDDLLLREAVKNKMKIGIIKNPGSFVFTNAKETFEDFVQQKSRHTSTSNYYSNKIKFLLGFWHILNLLMLFSPFLFLINTNFIYLFFVKIVSNVVLIKILMKDFSYNFGLIETIYLQIIYELLLVVNYFKGIFNKNKW